MFDTLQTPEEKSACGVGFIASLKSKPSHANVRLALDALRCVEHRGACAADQITGDGAGIMTDIPFELLGYKPGSIAVASLFTPTDTERRRIALRVFEQTFQFFGLEIIQYRAVPTDPGVLGDEALESLPGVVQVIIKRPDHCRTDASFDKLLYNARQMTRTKEKEAGIYKEFFFTSLSARTLVYKGLTRAQDLERFYLDLQNPAFESRFALFHRRFSTNTRTSWDKVQPFRLIGHNGEINTIAGNRSWAYSREQYLGLRTDELLTAKGISDSGSLNEMVEALLYRSSIPHVEDILALMMPPAHSGNSFYEFWSRAMEPWDGPAFVTYSDGHTIGARLDRNGFRPCRWMLTDDHFYLSSEAGAFTVDESKVLKKGSLHAGSGVKVDLDYGKVHFRDPSNSRENSKAVFDTGLFAIPKDTEETTAHSKDDSSGDATYIFGYTNEELDKVLVPMVNEGKEPIGSMGDTARPAILSDEPRSFFDFFYQNFAQVTNPPLDYIREEMVTELTIYLGKKPNIFEPKELIPPAAAIKLDSPVLSLAEFAFIRDLHLFKEHGKFLKTAILDITYSRTEAAVGIQSGLRQIAKQACEAVERGRNIIVLSDQNAGFERPPIPTLLALRSVVQALNRNGLRLNASIVVHTGEVRNTHQLAALVSFGASAVCPWLALSLARDGNLRKTKPETATEREQNLIKALKGGLLKIMAKMGISVAQSYLSSKLYTPLGVGKEITKAYFPGLTSPVNGVEIPHLADMIEQRLKVGEIHVESGKVIKSYFYKEHNKGLVGEKHAMTNTRSKLIHDLVREENISLDNPELYKAYLEAGTNDSPLAVRHLFKVNPASEPLAPEEVESEASIMKTFGSGAMSFGAISAESQRDIFLAMREIGGRSNSGEGGENPYYFTDGITASAKQVASARFGVTAEYLIPAEEFQIKVAQGAKPGEGGQLMGVKVDEHIARARFANPGVDLISPPPLHDIYSIEDLKQLIFELKQLKPGAKVNVKLVSGAHIGTIAVGVAKAGADIIHISGGDGGTGAASLSSMKNAGLPWEFGLAEVHRYLSSNRLRSNVELRVDGGIHTGEDILTAAILGADGFEFGKLLLVAEGCVMARICEKNTCPVGIATHDPKFKAKYKGNKDQIIRMLRYLATDVKNRLAAAGFKSLKEIRGRSDLLRLHPDHISLTEQKNLDLSYFLQPGAAVSHIISAVYDDGVNMLNRILLDEAKPALLAGKSVELKHNITTTDRAAFATLSGAIAKWVHTERLRRIKTGSNQREDIKFPGSVKVEMKGSAGQGFGVFLTQGIEIKLFGEANDSVCKSMSGGKVTIRPPQQAKFDASENAIIGNCALYGATGGVLYVCGLAGDRFAVRNSGATAVVEGTGLHACEYMTNGTVVVLGSLSANAGAGMTGGSLFVYGDQDDKINTSYLSGGELNEEDQQLLRMLLEDYTKEAGSKRATSILKNWKQSVVNFRKYIPVHQKEQAPLTETEEKENSETEAA
ncbi:MAG: glutamate synthase large subunit [Balneolales bacterium]|nr:glutamate synthase large subunit [Balneolales bacterium]